MGEGQLVIENPEGVAADQAVRVAGPAIRVLDDRVKRKCGQGHRHHGGAQGVVPSFQALNCAPAKLEPKATGALRWMPARVVASATLAAQAGVMSSSQGVGTGRPRSAARQAATASRARLVTPWSRLAENLATTSTSSPAWVSQTSKAGLVRPLPMARSKAMGVARESIRRVSRKSGRAWLVAMRRHPRRWRLGGLGVRRPWYAGR